MAIVMCALSVTVYEIFAVEICITWTFDLYNGPRPIVNVSITSRYTTSYLLTIAMFALSVTVCETNTLIYRNGLDSNL